MNIIKDKKIKAWAYLYKQTKDALPSKKRRKVNIKTIEIVDRLIKYSDDFLLVLWELTSEFRAPSCMIVGAIGACWNRELDISQANIFFQQGLEALRNKDYINLYKITARILKTFKEAPEISSHKYFSYNHPTFWNEIEKEIPDNEYPYDVEGSDFEDRAYAS